MAAEHQLVEGVGDEVVLFAAFLVLSICFLACLSLRGNRSRHRRQSDSEREGNDERSDEATSSPPATAVDDEGESVLERYVGEELSSDPANQQQSGETSDPASQQQSGETSDPASQQQSGETSDPASQQQSGETSDPASQQQSGETSDPASQQQSGETSDPASQQQSGETTVRARFPQPHSDEGEGDESLSIRLILPNNSTINVNAQHSTTLGDLRRMHFQEQLSERRPVRFIYQGRVLENDAQTLQELGVGAHHAIHIHIGRPRPLNGQDNQNIGPQPPGQMLDISQLFLPLFGLIIAICWVSMFCFPYVFTLVTKILLFVLSLVYVFLTYIMTRTNTT